MAKNQAYLARKKQRRKLRKKAAHHTPARTVSFTGKASTDPPSGKVIVPKKKNRKRRLLWELVAHSRTIGQIEVTIRSKGYLLDIVDLIKLQRELIARKERVEELHLLLA